MRHGVDFISIYDSTLLYLGTSSLQMLTTTSQRNQSDNLIDDTTC